MRIELSAHPDFPCEAVAAIVVEAVRPGRGLLNLSYRLRGDTTRLAIPPRAKAARADELWRRTCFEAFVKAPDAPGYVEVNLSPSTEWAAYRFSGYREGMAPIAALATLAIEARLSAAELRLDVAIDLAPVSEIAPEAPWLLALTAVVEEAAGRVSYWSAAHPAGRPDFHSAAGFVVPLNLEGRG